MPMLVEGARQTINTVVNTVQEITREISKPRKKKEEEKKHNVYVLRNHNTKKVEYVGRTQKLESAEYRHHNNPYRVHLDFDPVARNVSQYTARGLEQVLIMECRTLSRNKDFPMNNQINGVSIRSRNYNLYWDYAITWRSENEFSCN